MKKKLFTDDEHEAVLLAAKQYERSAAEYQREGVKDASFEHMKLSNALYVVARKIRLGK